MIGSRLHWIDWLLILVYGIGVVLLGWYNSRRQNSKEEYFTGGRNMPAGLVGVSLFVTLLSTVSYLSQPGEMIKHGPVVVAGLLAIPISYWIVGYILIPAIMQRRITSAYELLENQLGSNVRQMGAIMFILLRLVWMSLLLYLTAIALVTVLGLSEDWTTVVAMIAGSIAILYTSMGGIRTVIVTDAIQFVLLLGGALLTLAIVTARMNGFDWLPTEWAPHWDHQPFFSFDVHVRATVVGSIISILIIQVATAGGDQVAIQRYMSTDGPQSARKAYLVKSIAQVFVFLILSSIGFGLLAFFNEFPGSLPPGVDVINNADRLFPLFIAEFLPVGFSGLVVVAIFAAAMSSIDSGVNSISAVVQTDFVDRYRQAGASESGETTGSKFLVAGTGLLVIALSHFMQFVPGNFLELTMKTANILVVPLFCLFVLALFVPFATATGAIVGTILGFLAGMVVAYWDLITNTQAISFQYIGISSLVTSLVAGSAVSYLGPKAKHRKAS